MAAIVRKTPLPGPRSAEYLRKKELFIPAALAELVPVIIDHAEGALVTDIDGNTFVDMGGGIGCLNVGHTAEGVLAAVESQARRFFHTDFTVIPYAPYIDLAERLARLAPGNERHKTAFFNSGAEAVENAVKIARAYTGRPAVIVFEGAFHGRTLLAMTMTSKVVPYKHGFGPFAPEVYRAPFPYCYRCPLGLEPSNCANACADRLERMFQTHVAPDSVAALVVEPVLGEGGFVVPPAEFLRRLEEICRRHGIVFVADEIQTGFGRTGRMFAVEHAGVAPDLIVLAKSLAAGLPLSAVVGRAEVMDAPGDSAIGGTYVGNPVACAAGIAVLDIIGSQQLLERARHIGEVVLARFHEMQQRYELIGDVRGLGAMVAMELVRNRDTKEPAPAETAAILRGALERGAIFLKAGIHGNVIRILAPLVTTDDQLDEALAALDGAFAAHLGPS